MKTFKDLIFKKHPVMGFAKHANLYFPNGYGVSVITGENAYTSFEAPYELAVLKGNIKESHLTYDTPITDDVIGHLTEKEITKKMEEVQNLPLKD